MQNIVHLTMAPVENDVRILRTVEALSQAGHQCQLLSPDNGLHISAMNRPRKFQLALSYGIMGRLGKRACSTAFWSMKENRQAYDKLLATDAEIIHAHDWDALPIAVAAGEKLGVPVIYDSHEFASEMHHERWAWRIFMSPAIGQLEASNIGKCSCVITVSNGIAEELEARYQLQSKPTLIRNIPHYQPIQKSARKRKGLLLHYHGILAKGRGLELAIETLVILPDRYELRITGPVRQPDYLQQLENLAINLSVEDRVEFVDAINPAALIAHGAEADIGLCILPLDNIHNRFALPNKLFEYIAAGLCCIVSGGQDMADIVRQYEVGIILDKNNKEHLAKAILAIDEKQLQTFRRAGQLAAKQLCWENERHKLLDVYKALL